MSVRDVQSFFVFAEGDGFGTRSGQGILGETDVDALDLLLRRCVNYGNAVRIGVRDKEPRAVGIGRHCGGVAIDGNVFPHNAFAAQRDDCHGGIIPARHVSARIFAASQHDHAVGIDVLARFSGVVQIHSLHLSGTEEITHNRHAVAQVVRRDQSGAVWRRGPWDRVRPFLCCSPGAKLHSAC